MNRCTVCGSYGLTRSLSAIKTRTGGTAFRARVLCRACGVCTAAVRPTPDEAIDAAMDALARHEPRQRPEEEALFGPDILDAALDAQASDEEARE